MGMPSKSCMRDVSRDMSNFELTKRDLMAFTNGKKYNTIYADPPYLLTTRHGKQYACEMTKADHEDLLDALLAHKGPVLLSGYDSPMYNDALRAWHREEIDVRAQTATKRREILWMNFEPVEKQLKIF